MKRIIIIIITSILILASCEKALFSIFKTTKVSVSNYSNGKKQVRYIGMQHIGVQEYYDNVEKHIAEAKKEGYVLFYEWIDYDTATEKEKRKARKLTGFIPSPEGYAKLIKEMDIEDLVVQNQQQFLNLVNDKDFNIDLSPKEFVEAYESKYGELILTDIDINTPITDEIEVSEPKNQVNDIVVNVRNKHLVDEIIKSQYPKIIVMYGGLHEKGLVELLKNDDTNWTKK